MYVNETATQQHKKDNFPTACKTLLLSVLYFSDASLQSFYTVIMANVSEFYVII